MVIQTIVVRHTIENFATESFCNVISTPQILRLERPLSPSTSNQSNGISRLRHEAQLNILEEKEKEKQLTIEYLKSHLSIIIQLYFNKLYFI